MKNIIPPLTYTIKQPMFSMSAQGKKLFKMVVEEFEGLCRGNVAIDYLEWIYIHRMAFET